MPAVWLCALATRLVITARTKLNPLSRGRPADIGRSSFALFHDLEWVLLALMTPAIVFSQARIFYGTALSVLGFLLSFQSVWLIPKLNAQIASLMAHTPSQPSEAYLLYLGIDAAKIVLFAAIFWQGARRMLPLLRVSW
jgi:hypothetical protein